MAINYREQFAQYNRYFTKIIDTYNQKPIVRESLQLLLSLFTISFLVIFALRPTIDTISELLAKTRTEREVSEKLDTKIRALVSAKQVWDQEQGRLVFVNQALLDKASPQVLLQQIEGLCAIHNVTLTGFNEEDALLFGKSLKAQEIKTLVDPTKKPDLPGTRSIKYSFTVTGDFANISSFLLSLENMRTQIRIETFSLNSTNVKGSILLKVSGTFPYFDTSTIK